MKYSKIISSGKYLPRKLVKNDNLPDNLETSDEWIRSRTGIEQRYCAEGDETTAEMAAQAAQQALDNAGLKDVDLIIVATTTPDNTFPSTAASVQRKLGLKGCAAFDIQAVCSGFVFALSTADDYIKLGKAKNALVIGSETISKVLDWKDRGTCVLFGDGAGAVVLQASDEAGILSSHLHTDGTYYDELYVDGGVSTTQTAGLLRMNGREVFKHAVEKMGGAIIEGLEANNLEVADIDWLIPHQANKRIMEQCR